MRILITGVAGFIGSNLSNFLKNSYEIIGIDNLSSGLKSQVPKDILFYKKDIKDINHLNLKKIDFIFHLAAFSSIIDCQKFPNKAYVNNIIGTDEVFKFAIRNKVKGVIYAETSALYELVKKLPSVEDNISPGSIYSWSKLTNHWQAKFYSELSKTKFIGLRYLNVYGPNQDFRRTIPPVMAAFINKLIKNERPIIYGNGNKRRDFIFVEDVNDIHLSIIKNFRIFKKQDIFNVGTGKNHSILEVYEKLTNLLKIKNVKPIFKPNFDYEAQENKASTKKLKTFYKKKFTTIDDGLSIYLDYILENQ